MTPLRYYKMAECDAAGVPLDWERCRACRGEGQYVRGTDPSGPFSEACHLCKGHGSLKAVALAARCREQDQPGPGPVTIIGVRCEDCGHPMSEGTWDDDGSGVLAVEQRLHFALVDLRNAREPRGGKFIHYSPCDEGCRHGGPGRWFSGMGGWVFFDGNPRPHIHERPEASWRPVDIRPLDWPHDLRPESLAVLCLRCLAARPNPTRGAT